MVSHLTACEASIELRSTGILATLGLAPTTTTSLTPTGSSRAVSKTGGGDFVPHRECSLRESRESNRSARWRLIAAKCDRHSLQRRDLARALRRCSDPDGRPC